MASSKNLTQGPIFKNVFLFSLPLMATNVLQVLFNMSDVAVVGKFGADTSLGSVGSTTMIVNLFTGFMLGIGGGVNAIVARKFGAKDEDGIRRSVAASLELCVLLALLLMAPLFGILSTMIVTGRMSFFSDALGHSAFTGIAIGIICGVAAPIWAAVGFSVVFALLFSFVRSRSNQAADTLIGVFSSSAVALGIFVATVGGGSFTRYNKYLIGDILSVTPGEIGMLALVLLAVIVFWIFYSNRLTLTAIHPQLASSRGIPVGLSQTLFTAAIAVVVTLSISSVGLLILNSLLVLPGASARNVARNLKQYHGFSVLFAFLAGVVGLTVSYYSGCSAGAAISLGLAAIFAVTFCLRKVRA